MQIEDTSKMRNQNIKSLRSWHPTSGNARTIIRSWAGATQCQKCLPMFNLLIQSILYKLRRFQRVAVEWFSLMSLICQWLLASRNSPCNCICESEGTLPGSLSWNMINYPQRVLMPEGSLKEVQLKNISPAPCQCILKEVLISVWGDVWKKGKYLSVLWDWFRFL